MIVRNEARCIERCLRSARPHVDRMLVLDTGSTDDTVERARACGAEVHRTRWPDDFAAARNQALALADADWNLVLDADEWIASGGEMLRQACAGDPFVGVVQVRSESGPVHQRTVNNAWISRLLPRGVRYVGRVHEQPVTELARVRLPLVVAHDGYVGSQLEAKQGRNRALLEQALGQQPDDPYLHFQLGQDHEVYGELARAADHYLQALPRVPVGTPYRHALFTRLLYCLSKSGGLAQAITLAGEAMDEWAASPDYFFVLGNLFLDAAIEQPEEAGSQWLPMAESAWLRCIDIGEQPTLEGSVAGRGSFLAAHNLYALYEGMGNAAQATHYRQLSEQWRRQAGPSGTSSA